MITLSARVVERLSAVLLVSGLAITLLAVIAPEPAHAYAHEDYRFKYGKVCVIDRTGNAWPVYSATYRWTKVPDLSFKYGSRCDSRYKRQKVYVYEGWYGSDWRGGKNYAWTRCYFYNSSGDYEWLGNGWRAYYCKIWLNNTYRPRGWADRRSLIMHELGHASSLEHTSANALMNIYKWRYYNYPTYDDKRGVERRYPW